MKLLFYFFLKKHKMNTTSLQLNLKFIQKNIKCHITDDFFENPVIFDGITYEYNAIANQDCNLNKKLLINLNLKNITEMFKTSPQIFDECFLKSFVQNISCPITLEIINNPVIIDDGITYEYYAIQQWLLHNDTSPITREKIVNKPILNYNIKNIIDIFKSSEIYQEYFSCQIFLKLKENDKKNYLDSLNLELNKNSLTPINFICQYSSPEIIKYIIDKNVNLEVESNKSWRPIHYICQYSTPEMIQYIIDKGVNLEVSNINGWRPIHFICKYSTPEMIQYIIDKGVNLEAKTNHGWRPIHFICRYSTPEMIQYIINKGVDLEVSTNYGWNPIHIICKHSTPEMIEYIIDKGVNLEGKTINNEKPINYIIERNGSNVVIKLLQSKSLLNKFNNSLSDEIFEMEEEFDNSSIY